MRKSQWFITALAAVSTGITVLFSCKNTSGTIDQPPPTMFAAPVTQPLTLSKPVKINWDAIQAAPVHPVVKPFDLDKLPAQSYDTGGFKPFKYPVEEAKLDINTLPSKDLDIDKLPSQPLKFTTEKIPPPTLIHAGPPYLKDLNLSLFELGEAQGLIGKEIRCLFTDRDGFLWIGNHNGLYRYDGENLWLYKAENLARIWNLLQDASGRVWMSTMDGTLEVLDPRALTLKTTGLSSGIRNYFPTGMVRDNRQRIWLGGSRATGRGINIIDPKTQMLKWLDGGDSPANTTESQQITQDKEGRIWIAYAGGGLKVIDLNKKEIRTLSKANGIKSNMAASLLCDRAGLLWVGYQEGILNVLDFQKNTIQTIKEAQGAACASIFQDKRGKLWIGTYGYGLEILDPERQMAMNINKDRGLNGNVVLQFIQDSQGQVWIATETGLNMIGDNSTVTERIGKALVNVLEEDKQGLEWDITYYNGIDLINRKNKTARHLGAKQGLSNDTVNDVNEIDGKFYIPGSGGLDILDPAEKIITHIGKEQGFAGKPIEIAADKQGRIWLGGNNGLNIYDPKKNSVKHIGKAEGLSGDIENILTDARGQIWIQSTSDGIWVLDPDAMTIQNLNGDVAAFKDIQSGRFLPDKQGNMWISTTKGIYIADVKNKTLTNFSVHQGLIDDRVATILRRDNKIYASTVGGITIITPPEEGIVKNKKWGVQSFGKEYGLEKLNPGYGNTDAISSDSHVLWGDYGITVLDLSKKDTTRPPAYISGMNIMDQPASFLGRSHTGADGIVWDEVNGPSNMPVNLQLPNDQNYVQFNFSTLNFRTRDTTWYTYKLAGQDTGWSAKTTMDHSRNYFGLSPGKYTFEVASKSSDNGWSQPARLSFVIKPPWWQTWWAYILYITAFAGSTWGFVSLRSRQLLKEKRILEHKVHIRTEEVIQQKEEIEAQRDNLEKAFGDLKTTQNQLVQSEKMASLGELTAGIAHEIQNPLNFVNNFSEVNKELLEELKAETCLPAGRAQKPRTEWNEQLVTELINDLIDNEQKINHHGKRADSIVKGMLEHSRKNNGTKEPTDINALAEEYLRLSYHGLRAKDKSFNAEMITHFDANLPKLDVVPQDMGRVLLNLFNNAFYAVYQKSKTVAQHSFGAGAGYKPTVTVETFFLPLQGVGGLRVIDNGVGIPDTIKEKIMQPFFTTKPTGEGTGLGLSLTYDMVVKGHGGTISVESKEGEGSEFVITLPLPDMAT